VLCLTSHPSTVNKAVTLSFAFALMLHTWTLCSNPRLLYTNKGCSCALLLSRTNSSRWDFHNVNLDIMFPAWFAPPLQALINAESGNLDRAHMCSERQGSIYLAWTNFRSLLQNFSSKCQADLQKGYIFESYGGQSSASLNNLPAAVINLFQQVLSAGAVFRLFKPCLTSTTLFAAVGRR
jgi:hypothetical protein